jgi:hypothetical protein
MFSDRDWIGGGKNGEEEEEGEQQDWAMVPCAECERGGSHRSCTTPNRRGAGYTSDGNNASSRRVLRRGAVATTVCVDCRNSDRDANESMLA